MVNNPRGKLLNQSDRSYYFTQKSAEGLAYKPQLFSFGEMVVEETILGEVTVTFF